MKGVIEMLTIKLTQNQTTLIDVIDSDLSNIKWFAHKKIRKCGDVFYVQRFNNERNIEHLHRIILSRVLNRELSKNEFVDHIDGNPLNNKRCNLRLVNNTENCRNQRKTPDTVS